MRNPLLGLDKYLSRARIDYRSARHAPVDAHFDRLHYVMLTEPQWIDVHTLRCPAINLPHDHVRRRVDQAPCQVSRVRGFQGRIGSSLAPAMRGDEVLHHIQPLAEVGDDRSLDNLP